MAIRVLVLSVLLATMVAPLPVRADDAPPEVRPATRPAAVARMLADALSNKDAAKRRARIDALARDGGKEALAALGTILLKGENTMRQAALDALIAAGETGGGDVLADFLWKGGWVWRLKVIEALKAWGSPNAIPALKIAAKDPERRVRLAGKAAMSVVTARIAKAREHAAQKRIRAVAQLIGGTNPQAQARLKAAAGDPDPRVRAVAALVLGRLHGGGAGDTLKALAADQRAGVEAAVDWARLRLTGGQVTKAHAELAAKLRKPLPPRQGQAHLGVRIEQIEADCGVRVHVNWGQLRRLGIEKSRVVSCRDGSLAAVMDDLVRQIGQPRIDWKAERDILMVAGTETLLRPWLHACEVRMDSVDTTPQATRSIRTRLALRSPRQEFDSVPLGQCVRFVREAGNVDVLVHWGPRGVGEVTAGTKLTARASDASVSDMLGLLLRSQDDWPWDAHVAYAVVDGMVVMSSVKDLLRWRQSRPEGLSVPEAMIATELRVGDSWGCEVIQGNVPRNVHIVWLVETDRATTAANVLRTLDQRRRGCVSTGGLFWAVMAGRVNMVRVFLAGGGNVNSTWQHTRGGKHGEIVWTRNIPHYPLHLAARAGNAEIVAMLIRAGARPDVMREHLGSPLHVAVRWGNYMALAALIAGGADVEIEWKHTRPLHLAAEAGRERIVSLLIDKGARVNAPSKTGTPLQRARTALKQAEKELGNALGRRITELKAHIARLRAVARILEAQGDKMAPVALWPHNVAWASCP